MLRTVIHASPNLLRYVLAFVRGVWLWWLLRRGRALLMWGGVTGCSLLLVGVWMLLLPAPWSLGTWGLGEKGCYANGGASWFLGLGLHLGCGQSLGWGGSDACRLVRQLASCVQYFSWRASWIQLLREPKLSIVTLGMLVKRRPRFLMM